MSINTFSKGGFYALRQALNILGIEQPKTYKQEILYHLIMKGRVSLFDFTYLSDFRKYISLLINEDGISISKEDKTAFNKYKNAYTYRIHTLVNRKQAIEIYKQLTSKNK